MHSLARVVTNSLHVKVQGHSGASARAACPTAEVFAENLCLMFLKLSHLRWIYRHICASELPVHHMRTHARCFRRQAPQHAQHACVQVVDVKKLEREALWTAVVSFPLMVMAAVGLDAALVVVSLVPSVAFFIGFESIMPAYYAYRLLVEVVLEAVPQVRHPSLGCLNRRRHDS